jgi:hypothetical protein
MIFIADHVVPPFVLRFITRLTSCFGSPGSDILFFRPSAKANTEPSSAVWIAGIRYAKNPSWPETKTSTGLGAACETTHTKKAIAAILNLSMTAVLPCASLLTSHFFQHIMEHEFAAALADLNLCNRFVRVAR